MQPFHHHLHTQQTESADLGQQHQLLSHLSFNQSSQLQPIKRLNRILDSNRASSASQTCYISTSKELSRARYRARALSHNYTLKLSCVSRRKAQRRWQRSIDTARYRIAISISVCGHLRLVLNARSRALTVRISSKPLMDIFDIRRLRHASTKENKIHSAPRRAFGKKKTESSLLRRQTNILEELCDASRAHLTHVTSNKNDINSRKGLSVRNNRREALDRSTVRTYV